MADRTRSFPEEGRKEGEEEEWREDEGGKGEVKEEDGCQ